MLLARKVIVAALLLCGATVCGADSDEMSFDELAAQTKVVLELIASRDLSDEEVRRATDEFYALFDRRCAERCKDAVQGNLNRVEPMKSAQGTPRDLLARQYYSRTMYFSPLQAGSFIQQLCDEVDPVQLADAKSERIMTHGDVLGVLNIRRFLHAGGRPATRRFDDAEIHSVMENYRERFVDGVFKMPFQAGLAAELWAGVEQNWDRLDRAQQEQLRGFLQNKDGKATMDRGVFQLVLGLDEVSAADYKAEFTRQQQYARLEYLGYISMMGAVAVAANAGEAYWRW